ncbi:multicopper oxidase family protein [Phytomonospora endophytica]|uniref:FtsP/CotA-like multicopper oxidase with cupredoxin domain n=1 Tax=Phytomonospora endophytica TaxID=714109 RepID=A0A841FJT1_9ACTN|nr:multicopper oxidase family protein [Phytomonospora endophytica]MBB6036095.1 FtsP/CotA-like multicopper oxidase with cupredoxin domain [Phytomonospora endophytica]GIG66998.1 putative oxidase (copper-binding protein) [Phytomonospora endophytica]
MNGWKRRGVLAAGLTVTGAAITGCGTDPADPAGEAVGPADPAVAAAETARRAPSARVVEVELVARESTVDLGGTKVRTWSYGGTVPGAEIRVKAGDVLKVRLVNELPAETTVHWHGLALRNDMDGVPHLNQDAVPPGGEFHYEFTVPDAGTHWFHPHVGAQLDRGLYAPLIVEDPANPGDHDVEAVLVLDDWLDDIDGRDPDTQLATLKEGMDMAGHEGMTMFGSDLLGGDAGDVDHPLFVINGRTTADPFTVNAKPGQQVLLRLINAGADTAFRFAVAGHEFTVVATDGYPVEPVTTDALLIGMGERYDVVLTAGKGAFPIVAVAEGKEKRAAAILRTAPGRADVTAGLPELIGRPTTVDELTTPASHRLAEREPDVTHEVLLGGDMASYRWTINGAQHPDVPPLTVHEGQRARLVVKNATTMFHPMHLHGHTFQIAGKAGPLRKDTLLVLPGQEFALDVDAVNPGQWMIHCHNLYHGEAGMMATFSYLR